MWVSMQTIIASPEMNRRNWGPRQGVLPIILWKLSLNGQTNTFGNPGQISFSFQTYKTFNRYLVWHLIPLRALVFLSRNSDVYLRLQKMAAYIPEPAWTSPTGQRKNGPWIFKDSHKLEMPVIWNTRVGKEPNWVIMETLRIRSTTWTQSRAECTTRVIPQACPPHSLPPVWSWPEGTSTTALRPLFSFYLREFWMFVTCWVGSGSVQCSLSLSKISQYSFLCRSDVYPTAFIPEGNKYSRQCVSHTSARDQVDLSKDLISKLSISSANKRWDGWCGETLLRKLCRTGCPTSSTSW